jgi:hypothetical protein
MLCTRWDAPSSIWMRCSDTRWDVPCCEPVKYKLTIILCNIPHYRYSRCIHSFHHLEAVGQ